MGKNADMIQSGWEAVGRGDWDALLADYVDDMIFVMPGQNDVHEGKESFRSALENLGAALPPGFEITAMRHVEDDDDVVSLVSWKCEKVPEGSHCAVLFHINGDRIVEERWFIDTEQWRAAF